MICYKRYTGKLLPQKTAEQPRWIQWTDGFGDVSFVTGWMVKPNGQIKLNTPYGGK